MAVAVVVPVVVVVVVVVAAAAVAVVVEVTGVRMVVTVVVGYFENYLWVNDLQQDYMYHK